MSRKSDEWVDQARELARLTIEPGHSTGRAGTAEVGVALRRSLYDPPESGLAPLSMPDAEPMQAGGVNGRSLTLLSGLTGLHATC